MNRAPKAVSAILLLALLSCDDRGTGITGITPGLPASQLVITSQPTDSRVGVNISPALQVAVRNSAGQTISNSNASITVSITPATGTAGAVLTGTTTQVATSGVALFNNLSLDQAGTGYTLTFSSLNLTSAVSSAFNVTP